MEEPREEHKAAVKHLLRYVSGTLNYGLFYGRGGVKELIGYTDSDHGGDHENRRSTSGVLFYLVRNLITWQSRKQKTVFLSTCESEYIAAATGACQGVWLTRLMEELTGEKTGAPVLNIDNKLVVWMKGR